MSVAANKALARRFITQVWNAGELAAADLLIHPDYVVPGVGMGPEAVKRNVLAFREAFPDLVWTIDEVIGEDDRVAMRLTLRGTHRGVFRGIAPTGQRVTMEEMVFWRVADGQLHSGWFLADRFGLRVQLGVLPEM
jgi:predicted ester cyclase